MTKDKKYYSDMKRNELIGYCGIHCETPMALFSREMVAQMVEYAGCPENFPKPEEIIKGRELYPMHGSMETLVDLARSQQA
jgi:hypothetical protein